MGRKDCVARSLYICAYVIMAIGMPCFIVWVCLAMPPILIPDDMINLPANGLTIRFNERYGFVYYGFVFCIFMGFFAQSLAFFPGLINAVDAPPTSDKFFGSNGSVLQEAFRQVCALTAFSVAASEPKSLILRNWVGKLTMASRLRRVHPTLQPNSFHISAELANFGSADLPLLVDAFADEKHSGATRSLWEAWAAFASTSPEPLFLGKWASCQENMSMQEAMHGSDPFDPVMLHRDCGLPIEQVAAVLGCDLEKLQRKVDVLVADAQLAVSPTDLQLPWLGESPQVRMSQESLSAFTALRNAYCQGPEAHTKADDVVLERRFSFHDQAVVMFYASRAKPHETNSSQLKKRTIAEDHWVCLSEAYFTPLRPERKEAKCPFWTWARTAFCDERKSDWENLRRCYARVHSVCDGRVQLCDLSEGMRLYLNECPRLPDDASREDFTLPNVCLEPYISARGKAGALNFTVRLLASRNVLARQSLFAIFDARHMPHKKFWYWAMPSFFLEQPEGGFELNSRVSFVQAPQTFAKMPGTTDYLDLQNGFFYNVMNNMRNKAGAVTSCGTNAVWLLPGKDRLPYVGQNSDGVLWQFPFFEELTKIEDTATSHRCIAEGKYSLYVNPRAELSDEDGAFHPACVGVAKQGPDYLAALERWCEGAVQLFWVTLVRGPGRGPCVAIFMYFCAWLALLYWLVFGQPLFFCSKHSPMTPLLCEPFASLYDTLQYNYKRDYDQNEAWKLIAGKVAVQLLESWLWIGLFFVGSTVVLARVVSWGLLARYVVLFDNMVNYTSSLTCFYWVLVNVYLVLGFESPFRFDIAWLCVWFSLLTACRWSLLYSAKSQGNCEGLSLWRSQALWLLNAPGQVMAMLQGTKAAYDIVVRSVDKSWWIDPKELVKGLAKVWSILVFFFAPMSVAVVAWSWSHGKLLQQQVVSTVLLFYTACQIARPMAYIWDWHRPLRSRLPSALPAKNARGSTVVTTTLRALVEVVLPIAVAVALLASQPTPPSMLNLTPVARHGWLRIEGTQIIDEYGQPAVLHGVSLFWSQWEPRYWNYQTVRWLRDDWNASLVRAAMGVELDVDGYLRHPDLEKNKVERIVQACIANGVYVIIDWHVEQIRRGTDVDKNTTDTGGHDKVHKVAARDFFAEMSQRYGDHPNVLYELWDEPTAESWSKEIKTYYEETMAIIRSGERSARRRRDPTIAAKTQGLVILGTRHYSADVDDASEDPVDGENFAYALHFYQVAKPKDREWFRVRTWNALSRGAPIFVSEWGSSACDRCSVEIDSEESLLWLSFLEAYNISSANWAVSDKDESCSLLRPGANPSGDWPLDQISPAGKFIRSYMRGELKSPPGGGCAGHICPPCGNYSYAECMKGNATAHCGYCNFCCQQDKNTTATTTEAFDKALV
eukprot:TRINITY_DN23948_c0_g1_i1.p1 TRINITY_DN23948_c0_g1~~TRINITY_DN23948_c0_g1_i1.p1  ORF type:complete len:1396 (+),score=196.49 TRINITY_DN23948_c0_g1_i1:73-4260(+)